VIHFRCSCGKNMQAKEEFAGRRLKCPQCDKIVRIPQPAPSREMQPAPNMAAVAIATAPVPPIAKPMPPPRRVSRSTARPATPPQSHAATVHPHPWVDRSLVQTATPWLPGDEARCQAGIQPMREGLRCWEKAVLTLVIIGGIVGAVFAAKFLNA
jgi:hypothetical protein